MLVERIWAANPLRNYNYLVACPETGEALALDPLQWEQCLDLARQRGWTITQIVNTHEHPDHTGGNAGLIAATGAQLLAHTGAARRIGNVDRGLNGGDLIHIGRTVELECLDTPGHTMTHICLLAHMETPALFSGDTLFNAGVGNCRNGGDPEILYETCVRQLRRLSDDTRLYPGHDYLERNLAFTLDREPGNTDAASLLNNYRGKDPATAPITTLGQEKRINSFFRLDNPEIIARLQETAPALANKPDSKTVFLKLRQLRDRW